MGGGVLAGIMQQVCEEFFCHQGAALFHKFPVVPFPVNDAEGIAYFFREIAVVQRLFNIVTDAQTDGAFGVLELVIGADQDDFYQGIHGQGKAAHGDSVQVGHFNIRDDQIHRGTPHGFYGGIPVVLHVDDFRVQKLPVYILDNTLRGEGIVIHDHYFLHRCPPSVQM